MEAAKTETERLHAVYNERKVSLSSDRYSFLNPGHHFLISSAERSFLSAITPNISTDLSDMRVLDIGSGFGTWLANFSRLGFASKNLNGIDVIPERVEQAKIQYPGINFIEGSATSLPFPDNSFDMITQFVVFSSILCEETQRAIAQEMLRVLKPTGFIYWYDVRVKNPSNPNLVPFPRQALTALFPQCSVTLQSATLAPPLARITSRISFVLCTFLEMVPLLRTHYAGIIRKPFR